MCLLLLLMIDCGFRLSANNFLFVADTDSCKITLYQLLPIIQLIIGATLFTSIAHSIASQKQYYAQQRSLNVDFKVPTSPVLKTRV